MKLSQEGVDWMNVTPDSGFIQPDSTLMISLTLNAFDLIDTTYTGALIFEHDGVGGRTILPVIMEVIPLGITESEYLTPLEIGLLTAYPSLTGSQ